MRDNFRTNMYKYIAEYIAAEGNSPSFAQITAAMGISPRSKSLITRNLRILEQEGKLQLTKQGRHLLITLNQKKAGLPLLGRIAAGSPIEAIQNAETIDLAHLMEGQNRFALQVSGDSMIDEGIFDGDIVICKQAATAHEGDIIVALVDEQNATLKRISYKMAGMITLIPANTTLKPRAYSPERIQVQGIYIGLVRLHQ